MSDFLKHPQIDILRLLTDHDCYAHEIMREFGLTFMSCYRHLKFLEESGLMAGRYKYHITPKGRGILSLQKLLAKHPVGLRFRYAS